MLNIKQEENDTNEDGKGLQRHVTIRKKFKQRHSTMRRTSTIAGI